jgi:hypothetical protein
MPGIEREPSEDPHHLTGAKLAKLGVEILNRYDLLLRCRICAAEWTPALKPDGSLPRGYWQCPNKCNV